MISLMKTANINFKKGFTLIELLVVIGILSILVVGLIVAINPQDKLNAASDSRVINDTGAIARASEAYATSKNGAYPSTADYDTFMGTSSVPNSIVGNGDLKVKPSAPSAYTAYRIVADGTANFMLVGELKSKKYAGSCVAPSATGFIKYLSQTGVTCTGCAASVAAVAVGTACTPI